MIKRFLLVLIITIYTNICWAGSFEDALKSKNKVFLYFYIPECKTCIAFDKIYDSIKSKNNDFAYVRVNANTSYGRQLIYKYRGQHVPYIILVNSKTSKSVNINHSCIFDEICLMRAMKSFDN